MTKRLQRAILVGSALLVTSLAALVVLSLLNGNQRFAFLQGHQPVEQILHRATGPGKQNRIYTAYCFRADWQQISRQAIEEARSQGFRLEPGTYPMKAEIDNYVSLSTDDGMDGEDWSSLSLSKDTGDVTHSGSIVHHSERKGWVYIQIVEPDVGYLGRLIEFLGL